MHPVGGSIRLLVNISCNTSIRFIMAAIIVLLFLRGKLTAETSRMKYIMYVLYSV
jgi:hypothetical protein